MCATPYDRIEVKVALVQALRPLAASRGVQMLRACCDLDDAAAEETLTRGGFEFLATMLFMERAATKSSPKCQWDNRIRWVEYTAERHADFAQFIERSCEGALDCARLGEFRDVNLALESCRMRGSFDPSLRLLGEIDGAPARIILLIPQAESKTYELARMAVAPESRGKGLGRKVMEKGLSEVALRFRRRDGVARRGRGKHARGEPLPRVRLLPHRSPTRLLHVTGPVFTSHRTGGEIIPRATSVDFRRRDRG